MTMRVDFAQFAIPHNATSDELREWINELYRMWADTSDKLEECEALVLALFKTMDTLRINGHAPTGRQLDHYEKRMRELGIEVDK